MEQIYKRLGNLLSIKSLVTLVLTAVFAYLTCSGGVTADQFLTVFTVVIAFSLRHPAGEERQQKHLTAQTHIFFTDRKEKTT